MSSSPGIGKKTGAPKASPIWNWFEYHSDIDKSLCSLCDAAVAGNNTTNLKSHFRKHPERYSEFEALDKVRQEMREASKGDKASKRLLKRKTVDLDSGEESYLPNNTANANGNQKTLIPVPLGSTVWKVSDCTSVDKLDTGSRKKTVPSDAADILADSVMCTYHKLSPRRRLELRRKINELLLEYEMEELDEQTERANEMDTE